MNAGFVTIRVNIVTRYVTFVAEIVTNATEVVANPAVTAMVRQAAREQSFERLFHLQRADRVKRSKLSAVLCLRRWLMGIRTPSHITKSVPANAATAYRFTM